MAKGVPENEIAFIHDANTETRKAELFAKVRSGQVRFLLGSTAKMGAGTNVQDRLIALHHLDCPWKPAELEQQETYFLTVDKEIDMTAIFKAMGVKVESYADNYIQNISQYMKLIAELLSKRVVIFVNLGSYMEVDQIEEVIKEAAYNELAVLFIESSQKSRS